MTLEKLSQWYIGVVGSTAFFLISMNNPWGFVAMLTTEPFWFISSWQKRQWGIFAITAIYTVSCLLAVIRNFF